MRQARDLHARRRQLVDDKMRCRLAVDRCIDRKDDFVDIAAAHTPNQLRYRKVIGANSIECRKRSAQNVIPSVESGCAFESPKVSNIFNDNNCSSVATWIGADRARIDSIDVAAIGADRDSFFGDLHRSCQRNKQFVLVLNEVQRGAASRTLPRILRPGEIQTAGYTHELKHNIRQGETMTEVLLEDGAP